MFLPHYPEMGSPVLECFTNLKISKEIQEIPAKTAPEFEPLPPAQL